MNSQRWRFFELAGAPAGVEDPDRGARARAARSRSCRTTRFVEIASQTDIVRAPSEPISAAAVRGGSPSRGGARRRSVRDRTASGSSARPRAGERPISRQRPEAARLALDRGRSGARRSGRRERPRRPPRASAASSGAYGPPSVAGEERGDGPAVLRRTRTASSAGRPRRPATRPAARPAARPPASRSRWPAGRRRRRVPWMRRIGRSMRPRARRSRRRSRRRGGRAAGGRRASSARRAAQAIESGDRQPGEAERLAGQALRLGRGGRRDDGARRAGRRRRGQDRPDRAHRVAGDRPDRDLRPGDQRLERGERVGPELAGADRQRLRRVRAVAADVDRRGSGSRRRGGTRPSAGVRSRADSQPWTSATPGPGAPSAGRDEPARQASARRTRARRRPRTAGRASAGEICGGRGVGIAGPAPVEDGEAVGERERGAAIAGGDRPPDEDVARVKWDGTRAGRCQAWPSRRWTRAGRASAPIHSGRGETRTPRRPRHRARRRRRPRSRRPGGSSPGSITRT